MPVLVVKTEQIIQQTASSLSLCRFRWSHMLEHWNWFIEPSMPLLAFQVH